MLGPIRIKSFGKLRLASLSKMKLRYFFKTFLFAGHLLRPLDPVVGEIKTPPYGGVCVIYCNVTVFSSEIKVYLTSLEISLSVYVIVFPDWTLKYAYEYIL